MDDGEEIWVHAFSLDEALATTKEDYRYDQRRCHPECGFSRTLRATLPSLQDFLAQEWESTSTIHGALNRLQLVDFSFDRPVAVRER